MEGVDMATYGEQKKLLPIQTIFHPLDFRDSHVHASLPGIGEMRPTRTSSLELRISVCKTKASLPLGAVIFSRLALL